MDLVERSSPKEIERRAGQQEFPEPSRVWEMGINYTQCINAAPHEKPIWPLEKIGLYGLAEIQGEMVHVVANEGRARIPYLAIYVYVRRTHVRVTSKLIRVWVSLFLIMPSHSLG